MHDPEDDPFDTYAVVINDEEQYSIWPTEKPLPAGWRGVGKEGPRQECLDHIGEVWTDMRPLSLRRQLEEWEKNPPPPIDVEPDEPELPPLVDRLADGEHPVVFSGRPERTAQAFKTRLEMGYVHLTFTGTRGGTELGVHLDPEACDWTAADFDNASGAVRLVGQLTLDYVPVRCVAAIDLATLAGTGRLERTHAGTPAGAA
jgi:uncharacterized protein YbdZ (MbtH family)